MLDIQLSEEGAVTILSLSGPVDSATINEFKKAMDPVCRKKKLHLLIDCTKLTYLNSRSLGLLSSYRRKIYANGGRLALCGVDKRMVRTFDLLGLGKLLKVHETREEAIESLV